MPIVGYCHECAEWVPVAEDWSCPQGHPAAHVNGWYDSETGEPADPPRPSDEPEAPARSTSGPATPADASGTRVGFLADLTAAFALSPSYSASWGTDTDLIIASNPVDGMWGTGEERTEYAAALKVSEVDRTVYFWELLREQASRLALAPFDSENHFSRGAAQGPAAAAIGHGSTPWEWGYGTTRAVVEEVATRHGFTVRMVLSRRAATW